MTCGMIVAPSTPAASSTIIAFMLNPIVNRLRVFFTRFIRKIRPKTTEDSISKISKILSVVCALVFFLALITAFLWILLPALYESINSLYSNIDNYASNIEKYVNKLIKDHPDIIDVVNNYMNDLEENIKDVLAKNLLPNMDSVVQAIKNGIVGGLKILLNFVIGIIAAVYILLSKEKFSAQGKKIVYAILVKKMVIDSLKAAKMQIESLVDSLVVR